MDIVCYYVHINTMDTLYIPSMHLNDWVNLNLAVCKNIFILREHNR